MTHFGPDEAHFSKPFTVTAGIKQLKSDEKVTADKLEGFANYAI